MLKEKLDGRPRRDRGSYRHMLDLVSAGNFREILDGLLDGTGATVARDDHRHPRGRSKKEDWTETELEDYLGRHPVPQYAGLDRGWWIPFRGTRPTWDLICHLDVEGRPGLLLVEAKAHLSEMAEKNCKSAVDRENDRSVANDLSILAPARRSESRTERLGRGIVPPLC